MEGGLAQQRGSGQAPVVLAQSTKTSKIPLCLTEGRALSLVLTLPLHFQQGWASSATPSSAINPNFHEEPEKFKGILTTCTTLSALLNHLSPLRTPWTWGL